MIMCTVSVRKKDLAAKVHRPCVPQRKTVTQVCTAMYMKEEVYGSGEHRANMLLKVP